MTAPSAILIFASFTLALAARSVAAQPTSRAECVQLLTSDDGGALDQAAAHTLMAVDLRASAARDRRTAAEVVRETSRDSAAARAERVCGAIAMERVQTSALLTGYYRPVVPARRSKDEGFRYPLYRLPEPALRGRSRAEIDRGALDGRVSALAWLADPIEAFFIHVQGSAVLDLPDGRMAVGYAGSNGRPYTSIGALLVGDGRMRREDVTMESLKTYLRERPSERDAILRANERYVYFQQVPDAAVGSLGVPLTDGRSVAADPAVYPPGTLLFLDAPAGAAVSSRLVFVQDRGTAIVGPGRLDLYVGTGESAAKVAGPLKQNVDVYVVRAR
jgi:membrane-bound lytic murein transglycosylase A